MRVLLCHNNFGVQGGAEVFVHEVARVLTDNGHDVAFLAAAEEGADTEWASYFPQAVDYAGNKLAAIAGFGKMVYSREARNAASRLIKDFKPDIVHCFAIYTRLTPSILDVFREANIPVVCSFNDYKHICPSYKLYHHNQLCEDCRGRNFYHAILNRCAHDSIMYSTANALESYVHRFLNIYRKNVHTFLFASTYMAKKTEEFWGADTFRWDILRNPFEANRFEVAAHAGEYALYFGRLIEEKGVDVLVRAAAKAPGVPVVIVGDGPARAELEELARTLGAENVEFVGAKWGDALDEILQRSSFVVVPSLWHENFPYVILQAFAMGKAVIGTNRGGIPELVEHGERGYIYAADDAGALAAAMIKLRDNGTEATRLGSNAKRYADEEFNDRRFYQSVHAIYERVLS